VNVYGAMRLNVRCRLNEVLSRAPFYLMVATTIPDLWVSLKGGYKPCSGRQCFLRSNRVNALYIDNAVWQDGSKHVSGRPQARLRQGLEARVAKLGKQARQREGVEDALVSSITKETWFDGSELQGQCDVQTLERTNVKADVRCAQQLER
jgi:hypothetical protein